MRVLYVDDEADLLELGRLFLEKKGEFSVDTVLSASAALEILGKEPYDVIISDYQMPEMDGIAFLKEVRSRFNTIPFILFTGRGREEVVIQALNEGADFYLQKGGQPAAQFAELSHKIRQAVWQRQAEESLRTSEARMRFMLGFYDMAREPEKDLLAYAIEGAGAVTASPLGYLAFLSADEAELSMYAWSKTAMEECSTREKPLVYRVEQTGLWGEAVRQRIPVITNNYAAPNPKKKGCPEGHPRIIRHMNVPILDGEHIVIVAGVANKASGYTDDDVRQLTLLMQGLWQVLTRRRTEEELRTAHEQLTASEEELKSNLEELTRQDRMVRESESRLRSFFDATRDSVMIIDEEGFVIEWNAGSERISGIAKTNAISRYWWDIAVQLAIREHRTEQRRAAIEQAIRTALSTGIPVFSGPKTTEIERPDGTRVILRETVFPIRTEKGYRFGAISQDITAEKAMEDAFRESGERFRALVETSPDMIWEIDPAGNFRYISSRVSDILGYDPAVLVGKPVTVLIPEHARSSVMQEIGKHAASRSGLFTVEVPARHRDGRELTIEIRSAPVTDARGILTGLRGVAHDITEQKKMLSALADSEETYREIFNAVNDTIWIHDIVTFRFVYVNARMEDKFGYTAGEAPGLSVGDISSNEPPFTMETAVVLLKKAAAGEPQNFEWHCRHKDGHLFWSEVNLRRGTIAGRDYIIAIERDITERKRAEAALRESENRYRRVIEDIHAAVVVHNPDTSIRIINTAALDLLGLSHDEAIGRTAPHPSWHFTREDGSVLPLTEYPVNTVITTQKPLRNLLIGIFRPKSQDTIWVLVNADPEYDENGSISAILVTFIDITGRKRADEALRQANQQLNLLNSITRHDVVNQLTILQGYTQLAVMKESDPAVADILSRIDTSVQTISRQIEFTKTYQELGLRSPGWFRLGRIVEQTKCREVVFQDSCRDREIFADPLLERVFFNIFDNALRHGGHVTEITVRCERVPGGIVIIIEDDGTGIPADEKEKIFQRGFGKNTGLGLFLVREILSITGITIRETGEPGNGARFEIVVPDGVWRSVKAPG